MEDLCKRLTILETRFDERWDAHDKRAGENHVELTMKFDAFAKKLDTLCNQPCALHAEQISSLQVRINTIWGVVGIVISAILGLAIKIFIR